MRCKACDRALSDSEAVRKAPITGEYLDMCTKCLATIPNLEFYNSDEICPVDDDTVIAEAIQELSGFVLVPDNEESEE